MKDECEGCEEPGCQDCCNHDELDHGFCIDCEKDLNGSGRFNEDSGER